MKLQIIFRKNKKSVEEERKAHQSAGDSAGDSESQG